MNSKRAHLYNKGAELDVEVILSPNPPTLGFNPIDGWAESDRICVQGYKDDQICYFVGLHELGHIAMGHCDMREIWLENNLLEGESEAWNWALENSQEEIENDTIRFILSDFALGSYSRRNPSLVGYPGLYYNIVTEKLKNAETYNLVSRSDGIVPNFISIARKQGTT